MKCTVSIQEELSAIEHGVWITPIHKHCVHKNRTSINTFTGEKFLIGNIEWLKKEFTKMGVTYLILKE